MFEESSLMGSDSHPNIEINNSILKKTEKQDVAIKGLKYSLICQNKIVTLSVQDKNKLIYELRD